MFNQALMVLARSSMTNKYVVLTDINFNHEPISRTQQVWHFETYEDADRFIRAHKMPSQWKIYRQTSYETSGE